MFLSDYADVNECGRGTHNCHENATCTDVVGGFNCTCNTGYTGNWTLCVGEKDGMSIQMTIIGILVPRLSSLRNIAHGRSLIVMTFELNFKLKLTLKSRFKGHSII